MIYISCVNSRFFEHWLWLLRLNVSLVPWRLQTDSYIWRRFICLITDKCANKSVSHGFVWWDWFLYLYVKNYCNRFDLPNCRFKWFIVHGCGFNIHTIISYFIFISFCLNIFFLFVIQSSNVGFPSANLLWSFLWYLLSIQYMHMMNKSYMD